jgi:Protein of unknown function (DUF3567)
MHMLYNSDSYAVVQFQLPGIDAAPQGGFEIVDKFARREIVLQGAVAESFQRGVQALVEQGPSEESLDAYIAGYVTLAHHPLVLH